jgi:hypothetical protein
MPGRTIRELESAFEQLHEGLLRGEMAEGEFQAEVQQLRCQDDQGRQWKMGPYTGKWYRYEQGWWSQDTPPEPGAPQASPGAPAARVAKDPWWRPITPWLGAPLVILLLLASVLLVAGSNTEGWGGASAQIAQTTATPGISPTWLSASPTLEPTHTPPSPTPPPPTATLGSTATRRLPTPGQTPATASVEAPITPIPTGALATDEPSSYTDTPVPATATPVPTASAAASPVPSQTPRPSATLPPQPERASLSGRIFFPVYDPQPARRTFDIYAVRLGSGKREPVAGQASQPAISPDGQRLAYRSWEAGQQGLMVLELADGHTWRWVDAAEAARPSWSPNSQNLVFPSQHEYDRRWRIYRTEGLGFIQIQRGGSDIFGRVPSWLADGRIVYWDCPLASCGLYVMGSDGADPVRLTTGEHDTGPAASPDGRQVAFMSNHGGNWDIYIIDSRAPLGTEARRLTESGARDGLPTWSPNGKWLAFVSERGGTWAVWAMRPDGSDLQKLFDLDGPLDGTVVYAQAGEQASWTSETIAWGP